MASATTRPIFPSHSSTQTRADEDRHLKNAEAKKFPPSYSETLVWRGGARPTGPRRMVALRHVFALACFTVVLHVVSISFFYAPPSERSARPSAAATAAAAAAAAASPGHSPPPLELLLVTATQPAPCTTLHGDHMVQLALKNKWQHAGGLTSATARL